MNDTQNYFNIDIYVAHRNSLVKNKATFNSLLNKISNNEEMTNLMKEAANNLEESIKNFKEDLDSLKQFSKVDSHKIQDILKVRDISILMDTNKDLLSSAEASLTSYKTQLLETEKVRAEKVEPKTTSSYSLFDEYWKDSSKVNSEQLINKGKELLSQYSQNKNPQFLTIAHNYFEKAAELYMQAGNVQQAWQTRAMIAEIIKVPFDHPHFAEAINQDTKETGRSSSKGAEFSGFDSGTLKRGILCARKRNFEDGEKISINFHISKFAREKLSETLKEIMTNKDKFESSLPPSLQGQVSIQGVDDGYFKKTNGTYSRDLGQGVKLGKAIEIKFKNGLIRIPQDERYRSMIDRIVIEVDPGTSPEFALQQIHAITSMLGLGPIVGLEPAEEEERKKIALLFRSFYPEKAYTLENTQYFYEMSIDAIKDKIIKAEPNMKAIFDTYLANKEAMKKIEIAPNVWVWTIPDLADKMREKGAIGLMCGVQGDVEVLVSILKEGSTCSQERFETGEGLSSGTSAGQDHIHGGAGAVFTRLITRKMVETKQKQFIEESGTYELRPASLVERYPHFGQYQLIYDLSAVNVGAFAYREDHYGSKSPIYYQKRLNLIDFSASLDENSIANEVGIRERIPPQKIKKILVRSNFQKQSLIEKLKGKNLIIEKEGNLYIKGYETKSLDQLIIVNRYFEEQMWK